MADGYGIGLFDSSGPEKFAASITKITSALTGVQTGFTNFGNAANKSISGLSQLVDSLTKSLANLQKQAQQVQTTMGGGGGGGGGAGATAGGGSGGTGAANGQWVPSSMVGNPGGYNQGPLDTGQGIQPDGSAAAAQVKDQWGRMPEGTAIPQKTSMVSPGNEQGGINWGNAATSMIPAALGAAANQLQPGSAGANLIASAIQGQFIGASLGPSFGRFTGAQQQGAYVIPRGAFAQSAADYGQANMYMANYMGADPFGGQSVAGQNAAAFNRSAQQAMTMMPSMTRQQAMVMTNQMQQPGTLNAGLMFGLNFKPGGKAMDLQSQFSMIYQKLFAGFPGGKPTGDQFESYMSPGGPGENNLAALGVTPGSDTYGSFMQYARARIGMASQGKDITKVDLGTKAGAKAAGFGGTAAYAQLGAQTAKSRMESLAEPGLASAAKNLNDAAAALFKAADPLAHATSNLAGLFGHSGGLAGSVMGRIPGGSTAANLIGGIGGHLPVVGGIIRSIFQQGGLVPGDGPQLAVVHGGEYVLTKDDADKMQGKKGTQGGGGGIALTGLTGAPTDPKSIAKMLAGKPSDNPETLLAMLLAPPPTGSLLATSTKGAGQIGAGKTSAPAQGGGKGNGGGIADGTTSLDRLMTMLGITPGTPAASNLAALFTVGPTALGLGGIAGIAGIAGTAGGTPTTSPWNYKQAGMGPADLSGLYTASLGPGGAGGENQTASGSSNGQSGAASTTATTTTGATGAGTPPPAGGSYNQQTWAQQLLKSLGVPVTDANVQSLVKWENKEGGNWNNTASYNPLNTTQNEPGAKSMNSVGVKAYTSWQQGFQATVETLKNGYYPDILAALMSGRGMTGHEKGLQTWGTGSFARGTQLVARTQLALLHRGEAVVPAADNYSSSPYNKGGAVGGSSPFVQLNFKQGSVVLQVPPNQDMDKVAKQFIAAISKPQNLAIVRST